MRRCPKLDLSGARLLVHLSVFLLGGFVVTPAVCRADESAPTPPASAAHTAQTLRLGYSFSPVAGYDPTYGVMLGGAYFHGDAKSPVTSTSVVLIANFHGNYAVAARYKLWTDTHWFLGAEVGASNFFDSYFGEGDRTLLGNQMKIDNYKAYGIPTLGFRLDQDNTILFSAEIRDRTERSAKDAQGNAIAEVFGDDFTPAYGIAWQHDSRDNQDDTHHGRYFQTKVLLGPKSQSTRRDAENFARTSVEFRQYYSPVHAFTVAAQLQAGVSSGEPGYQYRYDLGGASDLRGYQTNRLRGRHFYEGQAEARLSLFRWLSVAGFASIGDTADTRLNQFNGPMVTRGGGIRIGLPPDFVAKARIDYGIAPDEKNLYLSFNEAF